MVAGQGTPNDDVRSGSQTHEEFLKLCALSTSGELTEAEQKRLQEHLALCPGCREAQKEFESVVDLGIPAVAPDLAEASKEDPSFSVDEAESLFLKRLSEQDKDSRSLLADAEPWLSPLSIRQSRNFRRRFDRYYLWLPMTAGIVLCTALGIVAYRSGIYRGAEVGKHFSKPAIQPASFEQTLEMANRDRDAANAQLAERNQAISDLQCEIARERSENTELKASHSDNQLALHRLSEEQKNLADERDRAVQQAASDKGVLQAKLEALERERSEDVIRAASLEGKVAELSRSLQEQEETKNEEEELLAKDRDIRELMGARDQTMSPLLPPGTCVRIDARQTHVKNEPFHRSAVRSPYARPIYFLDIRSGYICGWCQIENGILTVIPHPDSGVKTRTFRHPSEVEVVGRVTWIGVSLEDAPPSRLDDAIRRGPGKK